MQYDVYCILQNAYGRSLNPGILFSPWKQNHSYKRIARIFTGLNHEILFGNTSGVWGLTAKSIFPIDQQHMDKLTQALIYNSLQEEIKTLKLVYIICGNQALEAVRNNEKLKNFLKNELVIIMPHPASRSLPNKLLDLIQETIILNDKGLFRAVYKKGNPAFIQSFSF